MTNQRPVAASAELRKRIHTGHRDVTVLAQSRARLEASERRYRSLVENIPEVFWSARASDLTLTFVSPNVEAVCGYSPDALQGRIHGQPLSRVHPEDAERVTAALERAIEQRDKFDEVFRWQHADGKWLWLHSRAELAADENGEETLEGVLSDVTEKTATEQKLCRAQKIEAIGQLTAGIAHDFNNILSVILMDAEYLVTALAGEEGAIARELMDAAQRGAELSSRLLAFAQNRSSEPRSTDLGAVVEGVRPMLACAVGCRVSLSVSSPRDLGTICANKGELEQVLMNLAINARDAMPRGGELFIACSNMRVSSSEVVQDGHPGPGRYVMLSVRDTGTGMDEVTRRRIFEPFFTTKAEKGTGLGLSTSYGVVRHHGGHICVDSAPGKGTTFTIYFPRTDGESAMAVAPANAQRPPSLGPSRESSPPVQAALGEGA
jgi:two-component system cell cycle sensor histidine kinase/response regulator CckA